MSIRHGVTRRRFLGAWAAAAGGLLWPSARRLLAPGAAVAVDLRAGWITRAEVMFIQPK